MNNRRDFLENFKIKKALGDYKAYLNYGDKLHVFNCLYKVIAHKDDGYTILEDEKNSRFAIPSDKLSLLMKKGIAKNYGAISLTKSENKIKTSSPKQNTGSSEKRGPKGEPVGTVKQGGDGEWYKKTSDNPAQWVHVGKGTSHSAPGSEETHPLMKKEDQEKFLEVRDLIRTKAKPEDQGKLQEMAMSWVRQLHKAKSLQTLHNTPEVDSSGNKLPNQTHKFEVDKVHTEFDKASDLRSKFIRALVEAKKE